MASGPLNKKPLKKPWTDRNVGTNTYHEMQTPTKVVPGGGFHLFAFSPQFVGDMIQFDEHILQMG